MSASLFTLRNNRLSKMLQANVFPVLFGLARSQHLPLSLYNFLSDCLHSVFCFTWPVFSSPSPPLPLSGLMSGSRRLPDCLQQWPRRHSAGYLFRGVMLRMLLTHQITNKAGYKQVATPGAKKGSQNLQFL